MISRDDVRKLASLARIKVSPEEEEKLATDMGSILGYVEQIQQVSGALSPASTREKETVRNVLREDTTSHESGLYTDALLAEVPQREGQYVKVKKIL